MNKFYLLCVFAACALSANAQTLISFGNNTVSKDEFLRAYNRNKPAVTDKKKALRDYLDLYTNFKLKVKAADDIRLDTLQQIKYDVANFRNQIIENYMSDERGIERLQREAFQRSLKDRHIIHFFVPLAGADTLKAREAINEISRQLKSGKNDHAAIVQDVSKRLSASRQSDAGFVTVFTLPYEFENIVYTTPVGQSSAPYRSRNGWHVFKVAAERESMGKWKVAQVLFSFPPGATPAMQEEIGKKADSVYAFLQSGMHFGTAVKNYSDDKLSYLSDGELPEFGTGKYAYSFEKQVTSLKKDGDISRPFSTPFGYHIVKRLSYTPAIRDPKDESFQYDLKHKVLKDARVNVEKEKFARAILAKTKFKRSNLVKESELFRYADSLEKDPSLDRITKLPISSRVIGNFPDARVLGADWLKFVRDYKYTSGQYSGESYLQLWDKFLLASSAEYYKNHLEQFNPDFKFQIQEFKEGNMLFEIMERNVWNKAMTDSAGLLSMYNAQKQKYKWGPSADVLIFNCNTQQTAQHAIDEMKKGKDWKLVTQEANGNIQADSGRYEIDQILGTDYKGTPEANSFSPIATTSDGSAAFVKFLKLYPANLQRNFDEARGLVINDYQVYLEEEWMAQLRKKYPVKINEALFAQISR